MPEPVITGGTDLFTVLVADDNDVAQRLCKRVLEKAGYTVLIAVDGLEAVDVAFKRHPSMILMDVAAGADNVLSKPFRLADLVSIVAKLAQEQKVKDGK
jgi:CheY-like chemotaxis protein